MKESHVKGLATHDGPESCGDSRKESVEALTGERAGHDSYSDFDVNLFVWRLSRTHRHKAPFVPIGGS